MTTSPPWYQNIYSDESLNFFLDINDSGLNEQILRNHESLFQEAITAMHQLESGAIANFDEGRRVGHYWLRAPELAPDNLIKSAITDTIESIQKFANKILSGAIMSGAGQKFTDLLIIGIGGSALGPQFLADALAHQSGLNPHFLDNTDPDGMDKVFEAIKNVIPTTLVLVISKSGGTPETRNGMLEAREFFKVSGIDFASQSVAVTGEKSQLYDTAMTESWLNIFPMWDWVGGRTSVMSAVGLLPAALMGIDLQSFLAGARQMDVLTRSKVLMQNPAGILSLAWYTFGEGKGKRDMVILPYKDKLLLFSRYLQQLIMESLGKAVDLNGARVDQGIAVYGNKGSTDQHAYVQQLRDGLDNFFVTFIEVLKEREGSSIRVDEKNSSGEYLLGFLMGTQTALSQNARKSLTITIDEVTAESVGALIALYERAVGFYANFVNINAYHQPGVEAGKQAANKILELKDQILKLLEQKNAALSINEIANELGAGEHKRHIYMIIRHLAANHDLVVQGSFHDPENLRIG